MSLLSLIIRVKELNLFIGKDNIYKELCILVCLWNDCKTVFIFSIVIFEYNLNICAYIWNLLPLHGKCVL